jgi:hypothetical protein
MEPVAPDYFLKMIRNLRQNEQIMLYGHILEITDADAQAVRDFLKGEYDQESLGYPENVPSFDSGAALWAAQTIYIAAQLILYRENQEKDLSLLLPDYQSPPTAGGMLSADLCLRFLPQMITQLKNIDSEDALIGVLERKLIYWHYSGVAHPMDVDQLDFSVVDDPSMKQMYAERVIDYRKLSLALHPSLGEYISAQLGLYGHTLWKDFKKNISTSVT